MKIEQNTNEVMSPADAIAAVVMAQRVLEAQFTALNTAQGRRAWAVKRAVTAGCSLGELAEVTGLSVASIQKIRQRLGEAQPGRRVSAKTMARLVTLRNAGLTPEQTAETLNMKLSTVTRALAHAPAVAQG